MMYFLEKVVAEPIDEASGEGEFKLTCLVVQPPNLLQITIQPEIIVTRSVVIERGDFTTLPSHVDDSVSDLSTCFRDICGWQETT
jgi:hypothetical protein